MGGKCSNCGYVISDGVYQYSTKIHGKSLCMLCQVEGNFRTPNFINKHAVKLCKRLRESGINCTLEKRIDKYVADLFFEDIGIIIEVDEDSHFSKADKIVADIRKTIYYIEQGYGLIRLPEHIIKNRSYKIFTQLKETHDLIKNELEEVEDRNLDDIKKQLIESLIELGDTKYERYQQIIIANKSDKNIDSLHNPYCKRAYSKWSIEEVKLLEELFLDGLSFNDISILFERHPKAIKKRIRIINENKE